MTETRKPDIFTVRPPEESTPYSVAHILAELKTAGLDTESAIVNKGHTQPDGSTVYYVYLGDK